MPIGGIRRSQCIGVPPAWPVVEQAGEVRGHIQRELRQRSVGRVGPLSLIPESRIFLNHVHDM